MEAKMSKRVSAAMAVILGCNVLTAFDAVVAEKFQKLTGSQIRAKFAGMEVTDEVHWRDIYERDGTLRSDSMGGKRLGKWLVRQDELCLEYGSGTDEVCYEVQLSGNNVQLRPTGLGVAVGRCAAEADRPSLIAHCYKSERGRGTALFLIDQADSIGHVPSGRSRSVGTDTGRLDSRHRVSTSHLSPHTR